MLGFLEVMFKVLNRSVCQAKPRFALPKRENLPSCSVIVHYVITLVSHIEKRVWGVLKIGSNKVMMRVLNLCWLTTARKQINVVLQDSSGVWKETSKVGGDRRGHW